ncbi:hypothetical protein [Nocardiopsis sp. CC223A]|uniref:hypothetical protein n=1 Tax=Nocardiopsis sp. CC223A TaxID=3044051 RepID=UPI00278C6AB5|nr:hypothetical protein [Nocardiopsis sp. CC223A]
MCRGLGLEWGEDPEIAFERFTVVRPPEHTDGRPSCARACSRIGTEGNSVARQRMNAPPGSLYSVSIRKRIPGPPQRREQRFRDRTTETVPSAQGRWKGPIEASGSGLSEYAKKSFFP